jgi:hypothetical protein
VGEKDEIACGDSGGDIVMVRGIREPGGLERMEGDLERKLLFLVYPRDNPCQRCRAGGLDTDERYRIRKSSHEMGSRRGKRKIKEFR